MPLFEVGDGSGTAAQDLITLAVRPGDTVTVTNLSTSGANLNVFQNGVDQAATAVTPGNNLAITTAGPFWIQSASGVVQVQVTGGFYGVV